MADGPANGQEIVDTVTALASGAGSLAALGAGLVGALSGHIAFDRFKIGLIDGPRYRFRDAYVFGHNVPGRASGHARTLDGTVVEAAVRAREVFSFGAADPARWLERFPRFGPVLDSGVRSMLAVPLEDGGELAAALVVRVPRSGSPARRPKPVHRGRRSAPAPRRGPERRTNRRPVVPDLGVVVPGL